MLVLGGGNAGLCAALSARERGASVLVVECAPPEFRGGNSRHTRNLRCMHEAPTDVLTGAYTENEYFADLMRVTGGQSDEALARLTIQESAPASQWMRSYGARFQPSLGGTLHQRTAEGTHTCAHESHGATLPQSPTLPPLFPPTA